MEALRNEADRASAPAIECSSCQRSEILSGDDNRAGSGPQQSGQQRERRGFSAAGRSGNQPAFTCARFPTIDAQRQRSAVATFDAF